MAVYTFMHVNIQGILQELHDFIILLIQPQTMCYKSLEINY